MTPLTRRALALAALVLVIAGGAVSGRGNGDPPSRAEQVALEIDATLDQLEEPYYVALDLGIVWPLEVAPFLQYEGFTDEPTLPNVVFEPQSEGLNHVHLGGYTYCEPEVYINARFINWVSAWSDDISSLATLVHEMIHVQGGDFCLAGDSDTTESTTETATVEVLAAMANNGNYVALYAVLDELRGIAMDTALYEAIMANDLDGYREFRERIFPNDPVKTARFEKSMRHWATDMGTLRSILQKYSVTVLDHVLDGKITGVFPVGYHGETTVLLDDATYILQNLEELSEATPPGAE